MKDRATTVYEMHFGPVRIVDARATEAAKCLPTRIVAVDVHLEGSAGVGHKAAEVRDRTCAHTPPANMSFSGLHTRSP